MSIIVSGIRPTGHLHLGNYFGALKNFVKMQETENCFFFIADYHALTTHSNSQNLSQSVEIVLAEFLAAAINPEKCTFYVQSDVSEVAELYLLLSMHAYTGELMKTASFKEKARQQPNNVNAGLLTYPVLMAADILLHKAEKVPVGKDQEQHLEMTRNFAKRFNSIYKTNYFPEPIAYNFGENLIKIPGLDGSGKMGKSENNGIFLIDTPEIIRKKVMRATTDQGPLQQNQEMAESVKNIFTIMQIVSDSDIYQHFLQKYNDCSIRYGDMKKQLAEDVIKLVLPIQEKIKDISLNKEYLTKIRKQGQEKAKESAKKTLEEVRKIVLK